MQVNTGNAPRQTQEIRTKLVIGVDGVHSGVRNFMGQKVKNTFFAISAEVKTDYEYPYLFIDSEEIIPRGYAWIFPKRGVSNVGIGSLDSQKVKLGWDKFCSNFGLKATDFRGAYIPASLPCKTYFDNVMLVGDAGCLADALTGAEINSALVSGYLAAKVAKEAIEKDRLGSDFLKQYEKAFYALYLSKIILQGFYQPQNSYLSNSKMSVLKRHLSP